MATKNLPEPPEFIPMNDEGTERRAAIKTLIKGLKQENERPFVPGVQVDIRGIMTAAEPPPEDFVIPGFLAGTVGNLVSPGGVGKSLLAGQIGAAIAGADLLGYDGIKQGKVLILAMEDPITAIGKRLWSFGGALNPEQREAVYENCRWQSFFGFPFDIMQEADFEWLLETAKGYRLVIIDTLRRVHQCDENDSGQMAAVLNRMEQISVTGPSILNLHHTTKYAGANGVGGEQQASRGSSVLVDNVRFQMNLVGVTSEEARQWEIDPELRSYYMRLTVSKQNYGSPVPDRVFQKHAGGVVRPAEFSTSAITSKLAQEKKEKAKSNKKGPKYGNDKWV
jgi:RecA-family ATPase